MRPEARVAEAGGWRVRPPLLGISSVCNLLAAIKTAKYFDLDGNDVIFTVFTDSMQLYQSRLAELRTQRGACTRRAAIADHAGPLAHQSVAYFDRPISAFNGPAT